MRRRESFLAVALVLVAGVAAAAEPELDTNTPRPFFPAEKKDARPRFASSKASAVEKSLEMLTTAPPWYDYMPPWWMSPEAVKALPKGPMWSQSPQGEQVLHPQGNIMPYYNPEETILVEEAEERRGRAAGPQQQQKIFRSRPVLANHKFESLEE